MQVAKHKARRIVSSLKIIFHMRKCCANKCKRRRWIRFASAAVAASAAGGTAADIVFPPSAAVAVTNRPDSPTLAVTFVRAQPGEARCGATAC
eukprot:SAG11_NODE_3466_length_2431_cov_1.517153_3_plen_93_part_00